MLTVLGEALIDLVPVGEGDTADTYRSLPGGSPLNVAIGLARLGHPTTLLARLSTSGLGRRLRSHALASGVNLDNAVSSRRPATLAVVSRRPDGSADYDFYLEGTADWHWSPQELARLPERTRVLHTGSLACFLPPGADLILDLLQRERAAGQTLISVDPNIRPAAIGDRSHASTRVERLAGCAHLLRASAEDLAWLYPDQGVEEAARGLLSRGPSMVVVTLGARGALAMTCRAQVSVPAQPVAVVDTVGAGDAFTSGLLSALVGANTVSEETIELLSRSELAALLERATMVAALTCGRAGADPPCRADLP